MKRRYHDDGAVDLSRKSMTALRQTMLVMVLAAVVLICLVLACGGAAWQHAALHSWRP